MSKIRSIQVVNVRWLNATAWYGLYLSRLLREAGHKTMVIGLPGTTTFAKAQEWGLEPLALPMNDKSPVALTYLYGQLRRLTAEFRPDIVNCHRGESFVLWGLLKKSASFALVRTRGDQRPPKVNLPNRLLHKNTADAIIATNSISARAFSEELGVNPDKVFTILGGVDTLRFYPDNAAGMALRTKLGIAPDEFAIGILGRLDPVKGHEVLIKAVGIAARLRPTARLRLICIGSESHLKNADLENMARQANITEKMLITGQVDNVGAYLNALDLGVLASVGSETIARAALEIMACGVPLLSSDVGVMPDLLPADALLPLGNAEALAQGIVKCLDEPARLAALRGFGQEAMLNLKPEDFLRNTLTAYEYALKQN